MPLSELGSHHRINIPPTSEQPTNYVHTSSSDNNHRGSHGGQLLLSDHSHASSSPGSRSPTPPYVDYPEVSEVLAGLHWFMPEDNMPQYTMALSDHGIRTIQDISAASDDTLTAVGMPEGVLDTLRDYARRMALIAEGHGVSAPRF